MSDAAFWGRFLTICLTLWCALVLLSAAIEWRRR